MPIRRDSYAAWALAAAFCAAALLHAARANEGRPLLVTVDDLPLVGGDLHADPAERARITGELLDALARHDVPAVGLVTCGNIRGEADVALLRRWLDAGHELGHHSTRHLDYSRTDPDVWIEDVEACRARLDALLGPDRAPRWFRFPMLHEGDTPDKLARARAWLDETGQRNLPVTIDTIDWTFERPWVAARRAGDREALRRIGQEYQAALRLAVRHHERTGDALFGRPVAQTLLLHANEVGAAQWGELFGWLTANGHRFAGPDEVLADPAVATRPDYVGPRGPGLWDRLAADRRAATAREEIEALLAEQSAAWSAGDLDGFCRVYAKGTLFVSPSGLTRGGPEEIRARYARRYPDAAAMGTLTLEILDFVAHAGTETSMLGDARPGEVHAATVVARWSLDRAEEAGGAASGYTMLVFQRSPAGWRIARDASF